MRWKGRRESTNVEDRRSLSKGGVAVGGGAGALLLVVVLALLTGQDPGALLQEMQPEQPPAAAPGEAGADGVDDEAKQFVSVVLADTEDVWKEQFQQLGREYEEPVLVLFKGRVESACGLASAAVGPFYCPGDHKLYIDLAFFDELKRRFGAPGDFAQAYVIAHEVGHHVQTLLGTTAKVDALRSRLSKAEANQLSVRMELQADFLAGVWAHHAQKTKQILEPGDMEEALRAANAIGDDRLQQQAQGYVVPDSFTHGSSEQRIRWFRRGFETGDLSEGDTFAIPEDEL
jgi:predicted metalloprotease